MVTGGSRANARWMVVAAAVGAGLIAFGLGIWRLMPGVGFWDTAEFQMVGPVLGTAHPTGYPSYVIVGWIASALLTPIGEAALRMNVLSAILVGIASAFTVDLARRLSGSLILGFVAGLGLATTPIAWSIATHADPHALHLAFVAIILWLLVRWEHAVRGNPIDPGSATEPDLAEPLPRADRLLLAAAAVVGLSVGNHSLTLLLGPPILVYILVVDRGVFRRPRFVAANAAAFLIPTVLVRFEMILRAGWLRAPFVYADPSTWSGFWYVTLGAQFHSWVTDPFGNPGKRIGDLITIAIGQFGPLAVLILVAAIVTAFRQPRYFVLTGTTMVLTCFFNSVYPDGAIDRYYLGPALIAWTWLAVLGATAIDLIVGPVIGAIRRGAPGSLTWRTVGLVGVAALLALPTIQDLSRRATLVDDTGDMAAQTWTDEVLATVERNAVIVSWWSYSTPLWYAQVVDDQRPDVCIIDDRNRLDYHLGELAQVIDRYLATRPVYLIRNGDSELPALVGRYTVTRVGLPTASNLLRVTPIATGAVGAPGATLDAAWRGALASVGGSLPGPGPTTDTPALRADCP
jgi:hypothetical protein